MSIILIVHRYLGVLVGWLMTLWCLSGFVMLYSGGFPDLPNKDRIAGLRPLELVDCCALGDISLADDVRVSDFRVEMLGGRPVLRLAASGPPRLYDLRTGAGVGEITEADARAVALAFRERHGLSGEMVRVVPVKLDQWTLQHRRYAPLWRFDFADQAGTSLYISSRTGEAVQETTTRTRILAWLGAIPHWLYPTILRQNGPLWTQVIIWTSVLGIFLTAMGLVVGVARLRGRSGRWLPYRGVWLWHHAAGLFFGVLTLTWVASGLLTMQPWGLLTSEPPVGPADVAGDISWAETKALLRQTEQLARDHDLIQARAAILTDAPFLVATDAGGGKLRYGADGAPAPLTPEALEAALRSQGGALARATVALQQTEDAYYYGLMKPALLPVLRVDLNDAGATRLYLDPLAADFRTLVDDAARADRWLESGFHRFDFPGLRRRPLWDVVVILLLAGVTAVCATGTWLAVQRVRRDLTPGVRFRRDPQQLAPP
jgi:hypothetical protein